jgi:hypothetical protein
MGPSVPGSLAQSEANSNPWPAEGRPTSSQDEGELPLVPNKSYLPIFRFGHIRIRGVTLRQSERRADVVSPYETWT